MNWIDYQGIPIDNFIRQIRHSILCPLFCSWIWNIWTAGYRSIYGLTTIFNAYSNHLLDFRTSKGLLYWNWLVGHVYIILANWLPVTVIGPLFDPTRCSVFSHLMLQRCLERLQEIVSMNAFRTRPDPFEFTYQNVRAVYPVSLKTRSQFGSQ